MGFDAPIFRRAVLLAGFAIAAHANESATVEPPSRIESAARDAAVLAMPTLTPTQRLQAGPVDARLRVPACTQALRAAPGPGTHTRDRILIEVRCASPAWRVFVPARITGTRSVLALSRPASASHVLAAEDIETVTSDTAQLPLGHFDANVSLVGASLKRSLPAGAVLTDQLLNSPSAISRGQQVTLLASVGGIDVRMQGRALADGQVSQRIKVRNASSGRVVEGIARGPGVVEIISP